MLLFFQADKYDNIFLIIRKESVHFSNCFISLKFIPIKNTETTEDTKKNTELTKK